MGRTKRGRKVQLGKWEIIQALSDPVIVFDFQGKVVVVNRAFCELTGLSEQEVVGRDGEEVAQRSVAPEDLNKVLKAFRQAKEGTVIPAVSNTMVRQTDGKRFPVYFTTSFLGRDKSGGGYIIATLKDVSELKAIEEQLRQARDRLEQRVLERTALLQKINKALRRSEKMYRTLLKTSPNAVIVVDLGGRILEVSESTLKVFGFEEEKELLGKDGFSLVDPASLLLAREQYRNFVESSGKYPCRQEYILRRKDGSQFIGEVNAALVSGIYDREKAIVINVNDVTESKRLERELLEIGVRERRRIGQNLHDGLGQHLAGIAFLSRALENALKKESHPFAERASKIVNLVNEAIAQTRELARGLCPIELGMDGLKSALREIALQTKEVYGIECKCSCAPEIKVCDSMVADHLYYIALEAVTNAVRHSQARRIDIRLEREKGQPLLVVKDDGIGIQREGRDGSGVGIQIMKYRAGLINGRLEVRACPGGGTEVVCAFPLVVGRGVSNR